MFTARGLTLWPSLLALWRMKCKFSSETFLKKLSELEKRKRKFQPVVAITKPARQMGELKANDVAVLYNSLLILNHMDNMLVFWGRIIWSVICLLGPNCRLYKKLDGASKTEASLEVPKTCLLSFGQQGPPRAGQKKYKFYFLVFWNC